MVDSIVTFIVSAGSSAEILIGVRAITERTNPIGSEKSLINESIVHFLIQLFLSDRFCRCQFRNQLN